MENTLIEMNETNATNGTIETNATNGTIETNATNGTIETNEKKKILTEDLGKIFEMAICKLYIIDYDGNYKYSIEDAEKLKERIINFKHMFPYKIKHIAKKGNRYDFTCIENNSDDHKYLSAKTSKQKDGKVAPQVIGQSTKKKFCTFFNIDPDTTIDKIKDFIELNIKHLLKQYEIHTFDCPTIYYNKTKDSVSFIKQINSINWDIADISFSHRNKKKLWNESSTIYIKNNGKNISIGEFQFHNNRDNIKFRWCFEKVLDTFKDNFDITSF